MTINSKLSRLEVNYLKSMTPYVTKKDKNAYKALKDTLLSSIEGVFDDLGINIKKNTRDALEHMCFRSMEQGFVYTSPKYLEKEYGVAESTIYRNLGFLLKAGVLYKKNFSSMKQNGLGSGIYFFTSHPYFKHINDYLNLNWKADEKANEKAEIPESPYAESDLGDIATTTLSLPSLNLKELKDIDLQSTVSKSIDNRKFIEFVPKEINKVYAEIFDFRLRDIWQKITQAFKTIKQSVLFRQDLIRIGEKVCKRIYKVWKNHVREGKEMTVDNMKAYAYRCSRESFYNELASLHMEDYKVNGGNDNTVKSVVQSKNKKSAKSNKPVISMGDWVDDNMSKRVAKKQQLEDAKQYIPTLEDMYLNREDSCDDLHIIKENVLEAIRERFDMLDRHDMTHLDSSYTDYTMQKSLVSEYLDRQFELAMELASSMSR